MSSRIRTVPNVKTKRSGKHIFKQATEGSKKGRQNDFTHAKGRQNISRAKRKKH